MWYANVYLDCLMVSGGKAFLRKCINWSYK